MASTRSRSSSRFAEDKEILCIPDSEQYFEVCISSASRHSPFIWNRKGDPRVLKELDELVLIHTDLKQPDASHQSPGNLIVRDNLEFFALSGVAAFSNALTENVPGMGESKQGILPPVPLVDNTSFFFPILL